MPNNDERRTADAEYRAHMQKHVDDLARAVALMDERVDGIEKRQDEQHRQNTSALERINRALFDDHGDSRLQQILDLMTTLRMNGKALAWFALIATAFGSAGAWVWRQLIGHA